MKSLEVIEIATGEKKLAIYAPNKKGNKQFNVDGKFHTDEEFDRTFKIFNQIAYNQDNRGLGLLDHSNVSDNGYEDY